jgi:hypothetical protein
MVLLARSKPGRNLAVGVPIGLSVVTEGLGLRQQYWGRDICHLVTVSVSDVGITIVGLDVGLLPFTAHPKSAICCHTFCKPTKRVPTRW